MDKVKDIFAEFDQSVHPDEDERILEALREQELIGKEETFLFLFKKYRELKRKSHYSAANVKQLPEGARFY